MSLRDFYCSHREGKHRGITKSYSGCLENKLKQKCIKRKREMENGWEAAVAVGLPRQADRLSEEKVEQSQASASPFLVPPSMLPQAPSPMGL